LTASVLAAHAPRLSVTVASAPTVAAPSAAAHHDLLHECVTRAGSAPDAHRRGSVWQQPQRRLEQAVREQAVAFRHWAVAQGLNQIESAACLGLSPRTLRQWEHDAAAASLALAVRGRPVLRSPLAARTEVLEVLESVGPGVGLAVLQGHFPELPRAELADLLQRYRRVCAQRYHLTQHVLHWQVPGTVWAMDYAEPPLPLEEGFGQLLAVRDLASGQQLLWLPVAQATAQATVAALLELFALYGAPLVLKMDNGPPFVASATQTLLAQWQVLPLYSPPRLPAYNGSIEAGIGGLKARTHYQASRHGHPGLWTLADTEAARQQANSLGRPLGAHGPTPAEQWAQRRVVTAADRRAFQETVACLEEQARSAAVTATTAATVTADSAAQAALTAASVDAAPTPAPSAACAGSAPPAPRGAGPRPHESSGAPGPDTAAVRPSAEQAAQRRQALSRALVACGYLLFTRRRIPLPITKKKVANIP
jgi:transposase InsO family protein